MSDQKIFISYRRDDSGFAADRLYEYFEPHFGEENIFMDIDDIRAGEDFVKALEDAVNSCDVLIALIGKQWLNIKDEKGKRRLDDPKDFVRLEIATALKRNIRVIPVLLEGATLPQAKELPEDLILLDRRQAPRIWRKRFEQDVNDLIKDIKQHLADVAEKEAWERAESEQRALEKAKQEEQIALYMEKANVALEQKQWQTAHSNYREVLKLRPDHVQAQDGLQTASRNLELGQLYGRAILQQDEGNFEEALRTLNRIQDRDPDYRDVSVMIWGIEKLLAEQSTDLQPGWRHRFLKHLSHLPRGIWYLGGGIGLVLMLILAVWGGNNLLGSLGSTETPRPSMTTPVAMVSTKTNTPTTVVPTKTETPTQIITKTSQPTSTTVTLLPTNTLTSSPVASTMTPSLTPEELPKLITDDYGVPMALVPAGPFQMGSQTGEDKEKPVHTLTLDDFYIDQYEVTNARYAECVDSGVCEIPTSNSSSSRNNYFKKNEYDDYPVIYVSWQDAQTYCGWRGARLPTEAEWEKAARGGLNGALYPWGNEPPVCEIGAANGAKFDDGADCHDTDTEKVGSYGSNDYELFDMAGNVWEWTLSVYQDYPYDPLDGRENLESTDTRVLRGGGWEIGPNLLRVSSRGNNFPNASSAYYGFRCARDASP